MTDTTRILIGIVGVDLLFLLAMIGATNKFRRIYGSHVGSYFADFLHWLLVNLCFGVGALFIYGVCNWSVTW